MLHGSLGMAHGYVVAVGVTSMLGCKEEHFEVHHSVHDGVVASIVGHVARPCQQGSGGGIEERGERVGGADYGTAVSIVAGQAVGVAVAAIYQEAEVVVEHRLRQNRRKADGSLFGGGTHLRVLAVLVVVPQHAGPEAATPLLGAHGTARPRVRRALDIARHHGGVGRQMTEGGMHFLVAIGKVGIGVDTLGGSGA